MRHTRTVLWTMTGVYWVALFVMTHLPPSRLPRSPGNDKLKHFASYLVLSFLLGATLWHAFPSRRRWTPLLVVLAAMAYGVFDEVTQLAVGRSCELNDWLADVGGAASAGAALYLFQVFSARRARLRGEGGAGGGRAGLAAEGP